MLCLHKFEILDNRPIKVEFEDSESCGHLIDEVLRVRVKHILDNKQNEDYSRPENSGELFRTSIF